MREGADDESSDEKTDTANKQRRTVAIAKSGVSRSDPRFAFRVGRCPDFCHFICRSLRRPREAALRRQTIGNGLSVFRSLGRSSIWSIGGVAKGRQLGQKIKDSE